jgi:hypothetical protein
MMNISHAEKTWYDIFEMWKGRLNYAVRIMLLCVFASAANYLAGWLTRQAGIVLYLDTAFTITASLSGGLVAGVLTAVLSTIAIAAGYSYSLWSWGYYLFGLCNVTTALITCLFARLEKIDLVITRLPLPSVSPPPPGAEKPSFLRQLLLDRIIMLFMLSLVLCFMISIQGGISAVIIERFLKKSIVASFAPETWMKLGLLRQGMSLAIAEILARFPVNIIDRPVSVFAGYGAALLLKRILQGLKA